MLSLFFPSESQILILFLYSCKIKKVMQWYACIVILFLQEEEKRNTEFHMCTFDFVRLNEKWLDYAAFLSFDMQLSSSLSRTSFFLPNLYALLFLLKMLCDTWSLLFIYACLMLKFLKNHYKLPILCLLLFSLLSFDFLIVHENVLYPWSTNEDLFFVTL